MEFRLAAAADAEKLLSLINRAFRVESFFIDADRLQLAEVHERLHTGRFLMLEEDAAPLACAYLELRGTRAYLGLLSVEPERKGQGLGSRMMEAMEAQARGEGCSHVDITVVNLRVELPPIYRRRGYVETGTSPFPAGKPLKVPCHFIEMSKEL